MTFVSLLPVVLIAALLASAHSSAAGLLLGASAAVVSAIPFTLVGLAIGYALPMKAALVVAQVIFFPLAFLGGLLSSPTDAPSFVKAVAPYLPTRGSVELMWAAVGDFSTDNRSLVMLGVWTVAMAARAAWAYGRDERRRFS
jgi:ABC-2 type transport system permease protein